VLVQHAIRAVEAHGPDVTMDDIAAEASVTKPVVYRMIGDKAALTIVLSEWLIDRIDEATGAMRRGGGPPRDQFRDSVRAYLHTIDQHRNVFLFVNAGEPSSALFAQLVDRSAQSMIELFGAIRGRAGLDVVGARTWAYAMIGALQVVGTMWQTEQYCDLDDVADHLTGLAWDGIGAAIDGP
jgi:AcrR family transcriptional regulator